VSRCSASLASLADFAELPGKVQKLNHGPDDLLYETRWTIGLVSSLCRAFNDGMGTAVLCKVVSLESLAIGLGWDGSSCSPRSQSLPNPYRQSSTLSE
jgi:hypothetical protein